MRTDIGYGTNNVANNRLPVQTTGRDGAGTLIAMTAIVYDNVGNVVSVDGPLSGTVDKTVTRYDALRRVIGTVGPDPDGTGPRLNIGVRTTYDSRGLPTVIETGNLPGQADTDWASFVASQSLAREFDADRRLTKVSSAAGGATYAVRQVSFDTLGRVDCSTTRMNPSYFTQALASACAATSPGSFGPDRIIQYGYDTADRVTSVTSGVGTPDAIIQQAMTYYTGGRLHTLADGKSNKTTYDYDPYGRLDHTYYPHPVNVGTSSATDYEQNFYNAKSEITLVRRRSGDVIGTPRDALGRITQKDVPGTAEDVNFVYDNQGRLLSALYSSSGTPGIVQTYDGLGRLWTRTVFGRQLTYGYDLAGRRMRLTHPDGFFVTYGYSNVDELLTLTDSTGTVVATYGYDGLGARTSLTRPNSASTTYMPDPIKRLQQLTQDLSGTSFDLTTTFQSNPAGQISSKTLSNDSAYTAIPSPSTTTEQFDGQNQVTNFNGTTVVDDANANVWTGISSLAYTYDAIGQLRQGTGGANPVLVDYDPAGMLRRVTVGSTTTEFLYDGAALVAEYNGSTVLRRFVHGAGVDEPLVAYEGSGSANKTWLHADERGSIIAASNASGVAASSVKYDADGGSGALVSPFGYTGQLYLPELQLYYYKARMYSPRTGRFLQPDPIGYESGMNIYGYAGNDPVNLSDPSGLDPCLFGLNENWSTFVHSGDPAGGENVLILGSGFVCLISEPPGAVEQMGYPAQAGAQAGDASNGGGTSTGKGSLPDIVLPARAEKMAQLTWLCANGDTRACIQHDLLVKPFSPAPSDPLCNSPSRTNNPNLNRNVGYGGLAVAALTGLVVAVGAASGISETALAAGEAWHEIHIAYQYGMLNGVAPGLATGYFMTNPTCP